VPHTYTLDKKLGNWVQTQRARFKTGKMDPERKGKLNEIGLDFNPKGMTNEDFWNFQFQKLRQYYEIHGHCECLWAVDCLTFISNTPTNIQHVSLPELQAMCHVGTRKTNNWADGLTISVHASKLAN
jgi:hypothetical protein